MLEENRKLVRSFERELRLGNYSWDTVQRYLVSMRILSEQVGYSWGKASREQLKELVIDINESRIVDYDMSAETRKKFKTSLKSFYRLVLDDADRLGFMTIQVKQSERKELDVDELPGQAEVDRMIDASFNSRDRALIHTLWDSGARISEVMSLKWCDIDMEQDMAKATVDGKTGQRTVPLFQAIDAIRVWHRDHPCPDPDEPVFSKKHSPGRISYTAARNGIDRAASRADIQCKTNPHAFRKGRACHLAQKNEVNAFKLKKFMGWNSLETARRYIRIADANLVAMFQEWQ